MPPVLAGTAFTLKEISRWKKEVSGHRGACVDSARENMVPQTKFTLTIFSKYRSPKP
jgi:hypothetical protein